MVPAIAWCKGSNQYGTAQGLSSKRRRDGQGMLGIGSSRILAATQKMAVSLLLAALFAAMLGHELPDGAQDTQEHMYNT